MTNQYHHLSWIIRDFLTSQFLNKIIDENSILATNTSLNEFNNLSDKAVSITLNLFNVSLDVLPDLLDFTPLVLNESFINSNNRVLTLVENALSASTEDDVLVIYQLQDWMQKLLVAEDVIVDMQALSALMQMTSSHKHRNRNIEELLIYIPSIQNIDMPFLMSVAEMSKGIDVYAFLDSLETLSI